MKYGRCTEILGELEAARLARLHTIKGPLHAPHRTCRSTASNLILQKYSCPLKGLMYELGQSLVAVDVQMRPFSCCSLHQTMWLIKAEGFAMVGILGLVIA